MSFESPYKEFIFESCEYDSINCVAIFKYSFDSKRKFQETVNFSHVDGYNHDVLEKALFFAWIVAGISYYKCFPTREIRVDGTTLNLLQATFFSDIYLNGLSQYVYENGLQPADIAIFESGGKADDTSVAYDGNGVVVLQSGGKDSLLLADMIVDRGHVFTPWYMDQSTAYPAVLDTLAYPLRRVKRTIDRTALAKAKADGGLNGHVPVTFITLSYAIVDAILHNENTILAAIGREGEEPHAYIDDYAITHQWSKTWHAEQLLSEYVRCAISPNLRVGSPLRGFSELKIAELFANRTWPEKKDLFSSCNLANYRQGHDNTKLTWCGKCPKCANSYLLFAPFVPKEELDSIIGKKMFSEPLLRNTFKGLLGIDGVIKPFECVGEVDELRYAYHMALANGYDPLPFEVDASYFEKDYVAPHQKWAINMIR